MSNPGRYLILAAVIAAFAAIGWIAYDAKQVPLPQA
jgi:hypothetical protein